MKKRNNLHRYLQQNTDVDDVLHSHAIRKVGKKHGPVVPVARRAASPVRKSASANYRSSLVGSTMQYKEKMLTTPADQPDKKVTPKDENVVGNRPSSALRDKEKTDDASLKRRHHFIEPPKRNLNRFG